MRIRGITWRWLRMLAAPLLLAGAMAGLVMAPASAVTCQGWTGGQPPSPDIGTELDGVAAPSACDLWAVGRVDANVPGEEDTTTLIEHWTGGSSWTVVKSPSPGISARLTGVAAISANDVWAVGFWDDNSARHALTLHWDGTAWRQVPAFFPSNGFSQLSGVTSLSSKSVWAVGVYSAGNPTIHPLTLHWDGTAWRKVPSPTPAASVGHVQDVLGVSAASPSNVWAVGDMLAGTADRPLILHWNGSSWAQVASPSPGSGSRLSGVAVLSAKDAWAVGSYSPAGSQDLSLIEHWDGTAWTQVPSPSPGGGFATLSGVTAISPDNVWAVGIDGFKQALTVHWDGSSWQPVGTAVPETPGATGWLHAVAATSTGFVWTAGILGSSALAVPVQGQPQVQMAVQGRDGLLYEAGPVSGLVGNGLRMRAGTRASPALARDAQGGTEIAWVGQNGDLWTLDPAGHQTDTGLAADSVSPAVTALAHGGFEIAWVSGGVLRELGPGGTPSSPGGGLAVTPGTSPAIAANGVGGFEIAFSSFASSFAFGKLVTLDQDGTVTDTGSTVAGTTSPAVTALSTGGYEIAFKNNADGLLWTIGPDGTPVRASDGLGVADATTPAIAAGPGGGFEIAFHADGLNDLWTVDPSNLNHETHLPMAPGTSPAIAADPGGGFDIAIHTAGSDDLLTLDAALNNFETSVALGSLTSPAMAAPAVFPASTIVPNVISTDEQTQAEPLITKAGLTVGTITPNNQCRDVAGAVLNQDPTGGASVPLGTPVNMTVSTGTDAQGHKCVFD